MDEVCAGLLVVRRCAERPPCPPCTERRAVRDSGIPRSDIFVTTKLWLDRWGKENAGKAIDESLKVRGGAAVPLACLLCVAAMRLAGAPGLWAVSRPRKLRAIRPAASLSHSTHPPRCTCRDWPLITSTCSSCTPPGQRPHGWRLGLCSSDTPTWSVCGGGRACAFACLPASSPPLPGACSPALRGQRCARR